MNEAFSPFEIQLMRKLLRLASRKKGLTIPNPMVAAAVVNGDTIVATSAHEKVGTAHAERLALQKAGVLAKGCTLYITLEPCTHWGKNPPCTDAIIAAGISEVVYAVEDPNPLVKQSSSDQILKNAGIRVRKGLLANEAFVLNEVFMKNQLTQRPFVTLKAGMTLDGKIALANGNSRYITSESSLKKVHQLRRECDGILVGGQTVLMDNPSLTVRFGLLRGKYRNPTRIVVDKELCSPPDAAIFQNSGRVIILTSEKSVSFKQYSTLSNLAEVYAFPENAMGQLDWDCMLAFLYQKGLTHILIEGGQGIFTSAMESQVVDRAIFFVAPKLMMGTQSLSVFGGNGVPDLAHLISLDDCTYQRIGPDLMVSCRVSPLIPIV